jgi:predicted helicase
VKFIRFGQWRISQTGEGILAFISNNGYLDNPTFRGMRQSLLHDFDTIYLLNLHGSSKKKERAPDGGPDENVFDIQQGVTIGIFVRQPGHQTGAQATVYYADLWGEREGKYTYLGASDVSQTNWEQITPPPPWYLFTVWESESESEYVSKTYLPSTICANTSSGVKTHRDFFVIDTDRKALMRRIQQLRDNSITVEVLKSQVGWKDDEVQTLKAARDTLSRVDNWTDLILPFNYRPFDFRHIFYHPTLVTRARREIMRHMLEGDNICLGIGRQGHVVGHHTWSLIVVSENMVDNNIFRRGGVNVFPLYLYPEEGDMFAADERRPNLSDAFITDITERLGLAFKPDGSGDLAATVGPEDIFHYIYAVFHSPTYRERYAEFLKIDFPRVPLTRDRALFAALAAKGAALVDLHLLRLPGAGGVGGAGGAAALQSPGQQGLSAPEQGNNLVDKVRYVAPQGDQAGRVYFNKDQYFAGIEPETWEMHIGGYQPLEKWLKDRKGRTLEFDDVRHYLRVVVALRETRRLMGEIDGLIPGWPLE